MTWVPRNSSEYVVTQKSKQNPVALRRWNVGDENDNQQKNYNIKLNVFNTKIFNVQQQVHSMQQQQKQNYEGEREEIVYAARNLAAR